MILLVKEIAIGTVIAAVVLGGIYFLWKRNTGPADFRKTIENGKSKVVVKANKNLRKVVLVEFIDGEEMMLSRENVAKNERIEFVYPHSMERAKLIIEDEKGEHAMDVALA